MYIFCRRWTSCPSEWMGRSCHRRDRRNLGEGENFFFCRQVILVKNCLHCQPAPCQPVPWENQWLWVHQLTHQSHPRIPLLVLLAYLVELTIVALIEDMKRASRAQAAAAIAQESAWNDIAAYYRSITNNK